MVCKNRGIYGFTTASWIVITMAPRDTVSREAVVLSWRAYLRTVRRRLVASKCATT